MLGLILLLVFKVCSSIDVEAISGGTTTLICPFEGSSFHWKRVVNSSSSTLQQGAKYGNVNTASLIIYNVDLSDAGSYLCIAGSHQRYIQVTVIMIAIEGSTTTLTCPLQGTSFQWKKWINSRWSILQQGDKYGNVNTASLAIYDVDPHDGGTYFCTTGEQQLYMKIVFRAIAILGSNITLTCTLQGPNYHWQKRTDSGWFSQIQEGAKYGNVNSGFMTIYDVQINDGRRYRCGDYYNLEQVDVSVRVNGIWGSWGSWTQCTKTCVGGKRTRYRSCNNPTPVNGGSPCTGLDYETVSCSTTIVCIVNGDWGSWGSWTPCTKTCVGGTRTRYRACDNPSPVNGGSCIGLDNETGSCSTTISCPVNGNWGTWQDWNSCSVTCGSGSRARYQECNNPEPTDGGSNCQGNDTEIDSCSIKLCPAESAIYDTTGAPGSSNLDLHIYDGLQQNTESPTHRKHDVIYVNTII